MPFLLKTVVSMAYIKPFAPLYTVIPAQLDRACPDRFVP